MERGERGIARLNLSDSWRAPVARPGPRPTRLPLTGAGRAATSTAVPSSRAATHIGRRRASELGPARDRAELEARPPWRGPRRAPTATKGGRAPRGRPRCFLAVFMYCRRKLMYILSCAAGRPASSPYAERVRLVGRAADVDRRPQLARAQQRVSFDHPAWRPRGALAAGAPAAARRGRERQRGASAGEECGAPAARPVKVHSLKIAPRAAAK